MRAGTIAVARPGSGHRLGDQAPSLGGGGAGPIDVEDGDRLAHGVDIGTPGGAPELGGQERHGAIEPGAGAEVHGLGDGEPEEALDELVGGDAGLVDDEEPISGSGCAAHRRPPRAAARHGLTCISTRQKVQRSAFENVRSSGASPSSMSSPSLPASAGVLNPQRRQQTW
jgi:hypothetical protein